MRVICTAGVTASSDHMSRPLGIDWSCSVLKFCWMRVAVVSMTGDSPVTVTVSCRVARRQFDVEVRREAERKLDAFTPHGVEPGQLVGHRPRARGQRGEPVVAGFRGDGRLGAERRRTGGRDRHAGEHCALRIGHAPLNRTRAACAAALSKRARGGCRGQRHGQQPDEPSLHSYPPMARGGDLWAGRPRDRSRVRQRQTGRTSPKGSSSGPCNEDGRTHEDPGHGAAAPGPVP